MMKGDFRSSVSPTPAAQKPVLVKAKLGAEESGHPTAQSTLKAALNTCLFVGGGGTIFKLVNEDSELFKQCQEQSSGEQ